MKRSFLLILCLASLLYGGGTGGVTSRVRIAADESNKNWERIFFGERLRAIVGDTASDADAIPADEDSPAPPTAASSLQKKTPEKRKTVEYHIIQESSEQGKSVRKVKKRVVTEPSSSEGTATSEQQR